MPEDAGRPCRFLRETPDVRNNANAKDLFGKLLNATLYDWIALLILTAIAVWFIYKIRSWFLGGDGPDASEHQLLTQLHDLRSEGELSEEEYRSIKGRIAQQIEGTTRRQGDSGG